MTEKTNRFFDEVNITEDYDIDERTILLHGSKNRKLETAYFLDDVQLYENTRSTTKRKATEKEND